MALPSPEHLPDIELAAAIAAAYLDRSIDPRITVEVWDGVVTLSGLVESEREAKSARLVARRFVPASKIVDATTLGSGTANAANPAPSGVSKPPRYRADRPVSE